MKIEVGKTYEATHRSKIYAEGDKFRVERIHDPDKDERVVVAVTFEGGELYSDTIEQFEPDFLKEVKIPSELIEGMVYLLNEDSYSDFGTLLGKGYAVVLKGYDPLEERALIEFDGSKFWVDPSYLEVIKDDAPLDSADTPSKPAHYDTGIDTIAFMRANCPPEQVEGFLRGNALKYLQRYPKKNGVEDLKKSRHYIEMLIEELEGRA